MTDQDKHSKDSSGYEVSEEVYALLKKFRFARIVDGHFIVSQAEYDRLLSILGQELLDRQHVTSEPNWRYGN